MIERGTRPVNDTSLDAAEKEEIYYARAYNKRGQVKRSSSSTVPTNRISPRASMDISTAAE